MVLHNHTAEETGYDRYLCYPFDRVGRYRLRVSHDGGHWFQLIVGSDFTGRRAPVSRDRGQWFHAITGRTGQRTAVTPSPV